MILRKESKLTSLINSRISNVYVHPVWRSREQIHMVVVEDTNTHIRSPI